MTTRSTGAAASAPLSRLLDIAATAELLGTTERHIRRLVFEKRIPYLKVGHLVRFDPTELGRWLDEARVPAGSVGGHRGLGLAHRHGNERR